MHTPIYINIYIYIYAHIGPDFTFRCHSLINNYVMKYIYTYKIKILNTSLIKN